MATMTPNNGSHNNAGGLPFPKMQSSSSPEIKRDDDHDGNIVFVTTKMNYVTRDTVEINVHRDVSGVDTIYEGATWDAVEVPVYNARICSHPKTLDEHGYELVKSKPSNDDIDFMDTNDVIDRYYTDCENLLKKKLGSDKVVDVKAFDHNIRINTNTFGPKLKGGGESKAQVPLGMVHGDYTSVSAPRRLEDLAMPPKVNDVLKQRLGDNPLLDPTLVEDVKHGKRRFSIINVWRNIDRKHPVEELPLACMDASTAIEENFKILKIHYKDRVGQNYFLSPSDSNLWNYFPSMTYDEALLIKTWDSNGEYALSGKNGDTSPCATLAFHSAFVDPSSPPQSQPRKSIEVRCIILWEK